MYHHRAWYRSYRIDPLIMQNHFLAIVIKNHILAAKWVQIGPDRSKYVQIGPSKSKYVQICPNGSKQVQICHNWSKYIQMGPNRSKQIQIGSKQHLLLPPQHQEERRLERIFNLANTSKISVLISVSVRPREGQQHMHMGNFPHMMAVRACFKIGVFKLRSWKKVTQLCIISILAF